MCVYRESELHKQLEYIEIRYTEMTFKGKVNAHFHNILSLRLDYPSTSRNMILEPIKKTIDRFRLRPLLSREKEYDESYDLALQEGYVYKVDASVFVMK